jgi:hypothetical protein
VNSRRPPEWIDFRHVRIRARTSRETVGRPMRPRLFQAQYERKTWRCQATTVSGLTMTSVVRQAGHATESQATLRGRNTGDP